MADVQAAAPTLPQPSVFGPSVAVTPAAGRALTRASGTALHVEADRQYILVRRSIQGTCTRDEWDSPAHRKLAIAKAWKHAIGALRSEDEQFVAFAPVALWCDRMTGAVVVADARLPQDADGRWLTPDGRKLMGRPRLDGLVARRTSYARWAEGPLPHVSTEMEAAHTPDEDRDIQYLRHQNRALRELIDGALAPSEWAASANTHADDGLVNFRIRGVFQRADYRRLISKQTGESSGLLLDGGHVEVLPEVTAAPTTEAALDALLDASE